MIHNCRLNEVGNDIKFDFVFEQICENVQKCMTFVGKTREIKEMKERTILHLQYITLTKFYEMITIQRHYPKTL